jgi:chromosome partitioning protein
MIITVVNQKGGVGKTFTACVLAQLFEIADKRVVVADMDTQKNSVDYLQTMQGLPVFPSIDVFASPDAVPNFNELRGYDVIVIDTPPQVSSAPAVLKVIARSDAFIVPFPLQRHALYGVENTIAILPAGRPVLPVCQVPTSRTIEREKLLALVQSKLGQKNGDVMPVATLPVYSRVEFNLSERHDFFYRLTEREYEKFETFYKRVEEMLEAVRKE